MKKVGNCHGGPSYWRFFAGFSLKKVGSERFFNFSQERRRTSSNAAITQQRHSKERRPAAD